MPANLMGLPVSALIDSAVELREHDAGDIERVVKGLRGRHRVLADHRVDDEQDLRGVDGGLDVLQLGHERLINVQTAGRVEKDKVVAVFFRVLDAGLGDRDRIALPHLEHGNIELAADGLKLLDGSRAVHVARDE